MANLILLLLNLPLVGLWVKILEIPKPYLFAGIMSFALLGTYAVNGSRFDVGLLLCTGAAGYLMFRRRSRSPSTSCSHCFWGPACSWDGSPGRPRRTIAPRTRT